MEFEKEGLMSKEYEAFTVALEKVLSVSHAEIKQLEDEEKSKIALAPKRKRKVKPSASDRVSPEKD